MLDWKFEIGKINILTKEKNRQIGSVHNLMLSFGRKFEILYNARAELAPAAVNRKRGKSIFFFNP